jgi:hypothetical protein
MDHSAASREESWFASGTGRRGEMIPNPSDLSMCLMQEFCGKSPEIT